MVWPCDAQVWCGHVMHKGQCGGVHGYACVVVVVWPCDVCGVVMCGGVVWL